MFLDLVLYIGPLLWCPLGEDPITNTLEFRISRVLLLIQALIRMII